MKVAFLSQWYPPEPVEVPRGIATALAERGDEVMVLTGVPNYPSGRVTVGYRSWSVASEQIDGLSVKRFPLYPNHDSSAVKRIANYVSWAFSTAILGQRWLRSADAILVYSSPATAALPAIVARRLWKTPFVLLIQDVWPDSIVASGFLRGGLGRAVSGLINPFVQRTYESAEHVAVISPGMVDLLAKRGVPRDKLSIVYNWVPDEGPSAHADRGPGLSTLLSGAGIPAGSRIFLYAGNHGHAQALENLVRAFMDVATAPAHLVLLGDGVTKERLTELAAGHPRVHFMDPVDRATATRFLKEADVSVVSLTNDQLFSVTMPSKIQSGLASARPMLVVAEGDAAAVVVGANAGVAAPPGDHAKLCEAVRALSRLSDEELSAMGKRGRDVYQRQMARAVGIDRLSRLLERTASGRAGAYDVAPHEGGVRR